MLVFPATVLVFQETVTDSSIYTNQGHCFPGQLTKSMQISKFLDYKLLFLFIGHYLNIFILVMFLSTCLLSFLCFCLCFTIFGRDHSFFSRKNRTGNLHTVTNWVVYSFLKVELFLEM